MGIAKVTRNYQVTIPKDIRRIKNIAIGDTVLFTLEDGKVDFIKLDRGVLLNELAGSWKGTVKEDSLDYVRKIRSEWSKRTKRLGL